MNKTTASKPGTSGRTYIWPGLLLLWFVILCIVPDPRPFGAPDSIVESVRELLNLSDQIARTFTTIALRTAGLVILGILLLRSIESTKLRASRLVALLLAPVLAVSAQWINYTYFPILQQILFGAVSALSGVLLGISLRRNIAATAALVILIGGLFTWGTSSGISNELFESAQAIGQHVLEHADEIPPGDAGFEKTMEVAFNFAIDRAQKSDPVLPHRAAILALSTILGEEKVAKAAKREIDLSRLPEAEKLRRHITLYNRNDLARHFWVSAGLAVLSSEGQSMTIGIAKEMMDSAGGSGFSFADLTADRAGTLFTLAATRDKKSAYTLRSRIQNGVKIPDFIPNPADLPEGIQNDQFQEEYGGLGGEETKKIVEEIRHRLKKCEGLQLN
ncbi:MAG: hypothetical protein ABFR47_03190 [Verrucomicrobiota bacterium]